MQTHLASIDCDASIENAQSLAIRQPGVFRYLEMTFGNQGEALAAGVLLADALTRYCDTLESSSFPRLQSLNLQRAEERLRTADMTSFATRNEQALKYAEAIVDDVPMPLNRQEEARLRAALTTVLVAADEARPPF